MGDRSLGDVIFCDRWTKEKKLLRRRRSGGGGKRTARKKWPEGSQGWREVLGRSVVGSQQEGWQKSRSKVGYIRKLGCGGREK